MVLYGLLRRCPHASALERSGCAIRADAPSTLSVALDDALRRRADLGQAARDLGAPEAAERALALLEKLRDDAGAPKLPRGLPAGRLQSGDAVRYTHCRSADPARSGRIRLITP